MNIPLSKSLHLLWLWSKQHKEAAENVWFISMCWYWFWCHSQQGSRHRHLLFIHWGQDVVWSRVISRFLYPATKCVCVGWGVGVWVYWIHPVLPFWYMYQMDMDQDLGWDWIWMAYMYLTKYVHNDRSCDIFSHSWFVFCFHLEPSILVC